MNEIPKDELKEAKMELILRRVLAFLVPTSILSLTFLWWKGKNNKSLQTDLNRENNPEDLLTNKEKEAELLDKDTIEEDLGNDQFQLGCENFFEDDFDDLVTIEDTGMKTLNRNRHQSSGDGDSAYVEDYSSDGVSMSGSDTTINKSSEHANIDSVFAEIPFSEFIFLEELESNCKYRDWYNNTLEPSSEYKVMHWGSQPVSDIEGDEHTLNSDCVGGVAIEKLSIVLDNQYNEQKKKMKSQKSPRKKNKENFSIGKSELHSPMRKSSKSLKKTEISKKQTRSKKQVEKNDIGRPWREQSQVVPKSDQYMVREYEISEDLCGKIIGRHGKSVKEIHENTGATVCIECEKLGSKRVVSVAGLFSQVKKAEKLLISRFNNAMRKVGDEMFSDLLTSLEFSQLPCKSCVNVIVTAIINAGNLFVQIFDEDVDKELVNLQNEIAKNYAQVAQKLMYADEMKPKINDICISFIDNTWCRIKVMEYANADYILVSFIDYGGVVAVPWQMVYRVREEFLQMPAQGIQCYLANVFPLENENGYSYSANITMNQLVEGKYLRCYVHSVSDGVPCVELFYFNEDTNEEVSVNKRLVKWCLTASSPKQNESYLEKEVAPTEIILEEVEKSELVHQF